MSQNELYRSSTQQIKASFRVLFFGVGRAEAPTERDTAVGPAARRNAPIILTARIFATVVGMFAGFTPFAMGCVLLLGFLPAEAVPFGSQLVPYRRSI